MHNAHHAQLSVLVSDLSSRVKEGHDVQTKRALEVAALIYLKMMDMAHQT